MTFSISPAHVDDYDDFARLFAELQVPETVPDRARFVSAIAPEAIFVREGIRVAGYVWARARGDSLHVVHVVVDPAFRRRGVGQLLMRTAAAHGRSLGLDRWMLHVKPENHAARALYTSCGMQDAMQSVSMRATWAQLARVEGPRAHAGPLDLAHDAQFESALGLSPGEIAAARSLPGRSLFGATDDSGPVGIAAFDPGFPGISPIRVRAPRHARALFDAARPPHAADTDHLHVFVEGSPDLEAALAAVGAEPTMRVLRMQGMLTSGGEAPPASCRSGA